MKRNQIKNKIKRNQKRKNPKTKKQKQEKENFFSFLCFFVSKSRFSRYFTRKTPFYCESKLIFILQSLMFFQVLELKKKQSVNGEKNFYYSIKSYQIQSTSKLNEVFK
jgi:hypothetical protein